MAFWEGIAAGAQDVIGSVWAREGAKDSVSDARDWNLDMYNRQVTDVGNFATQDRIFQAQMQAQAMAFNANESRLSRLQTDTAMQRRVADLKAAGLNPMLAMPRGADTGASASIGGGSSSSHVPGAAGSPVAAVFRPNALTLSSARLANAQAQNVNANTLERVANVAKIEQETRTSATSAGQMEAQRQVLLATIEKVQAEIQDLRQRYNTGRATEEKLLQDRLTSAALAAVHEVEAKLKQKQITVAEAQAELMQVDTYLQRKKIAGAENLESLHKAAGPALSAVPFFASAAGALGIAGLARRALGKFAGESVGKSAGRLKGGR